MARQIVNVRYVVRVTVYDNNLNINQRYEKNFRLRTGAEQWATAKKKIYANQDIVSEFQIIKAEDNTIVHTLKNKAITKLRNKNKK